MIDLAKESLLSLPEAAATLPCTPHVSTVHRWCQRGIHGQRLETILIGGRRYTSREALQRFADAATAAACSEFANTEPVKGYGARDCRRSPRTSLERV